MSNSEINGAEHSAKDLCYVVSYDHGGLVLWGYEHFIHHFRDLLGWLDRHPKLKMGLDNEAWMYDWLAENQPGVIEEIQQALIKYKGRLGIATCTYGQPLGAYVLEESNLRQIILGISATGERLGYNVDIYSFSEHHAFPQLPQMLTGLGIRGALMRTHYLMYGHCPGYDVPIAWWESPDGSRVPCVPSYINQPRQVEGHSAHPPGPYGLTTEDTWILTRYPSKESPASLDAFKERFSHIRPLLATRLDDSGLKREALVDELDSRGEYRWATLEDVFDEFPAPNTTIKPTSEDFGTRMPWGFRGNELFDLSRRAEIAVLTAERLAARLAMEPGATSAEYMVDPFAADDVEDRLRQAWKDLLVGQHHDVQIVARSGGFGRERLLASVEKSQEIIRKLLRDKSNGDISGGRFIGFNPLPWPRNESTAVLPGGAMELPGPFSVPALGFATLDVPVEEIGAPAALSFETDLYRVVVNPNGGLDSLATRDGRPMLRPGSGSLAGVIDGKVCESAGTTVVLAKKAGFQVVEKGVIGPLAYTVRWLFPTHGKRIDYAVTVRFDGERIGAPTEQKNDSRSCFIHEQKLRSRFYPAVDPTTASGIYDTPFGVCTTMRPYVEGNYWTALADNAGGIAIANRGTMGCVREDDGAFAVPLAFSTNYIWGSEMICGERDWALGILPFTGKWEDAVLHRRALEFAFPIVAIPGAVAQPSRDMLRIDNPNIHLTALYANNGRDYLRLFNGSDREQKISLSTHGPVTPVDLRHREIAEPAEALTFGPWRIITVRLNDGPPLR